MLRTVALLILGAACRGPSVGFVDEVLGDCKGDFRAPGPYPNQLTPGDDLSRLTLSDASAVCNDGTPAVLYVRRGSDDWVMHLQGGGTCVDFEDCEARWCGTGYHDASKMSSAYAPGRTRGLGISSSDPRSDFANATHVFFYYCTSDAWSGVSLASLPAKDGREMMLYRTGHDILDVAFTVFREPQTSDDGRQTMPDLDNARSLVFSGTSGGSAGAQVNLDWVRAQLPETVPVFGVFDSAFGPRPELLPTEPERRLAVRSEDIVSSLDAASVDPAYSDESCREALAGTDESWKCLDPSEFAYDYVTTPFLARQDLYDTNVIDSYLQAGVTEDGFAKAVGASLSSLGRLPQTAFEGKSMTRAPSAYGPACGQHVALESDTWFFDAAVVVDGVPVSLHDAVSAAVSGATMSVVDGASGDASICPDLELVR